MPSAQFVSILAAGAMIAGARQEIFIPFPKVHTASLPYIYLAYLVGGTCMVYGASSQPESRASTRQTELPQS